MYFNFENNWDVLELSDEHGYSGAHKCQVNYGAIFSQLIEVISVAGDVGSVVSITSSQVNLVVLEKCQKLCLLDILREESVISGSSAALPSPLNLSRWSVANTLQLFDLHGVDFEQCVSLSLSLSLYLSLSPRPSILCVGVCCVFLGEG